MMDFMHACMILGCVFHLFSSFMQGHRILFSLSGLETELTNVAQSISPFSLSRKIYESMGQMYTLAHLVMTVPVSTASVEQIFSPLKQIETHTRNTTGQTDFQHELQWPNKETCYWTRGIRVT